MSIDLVIEDPRWPEKIETWAQNVELMTFEHLGLSVDDFETTILLTNDAHIRELNAQFRDKDKATDVLSWPAFEFDHDIGQVPNLPPIHDGPFEATLGDIALGFETCEADALNKSFENHIHHLLLHGFLHLLGYDHIDDRDAEIMERLEVEILKKMHINNPYDYEQD